MSGFIVIAPTVVAGVTYWSAAYFNQRPSMQGPEHADRVLVETISRAGRTRESASAAVLRKAPGATLLFA